MAADWIFIEDLREPATHSTHIWHRVGIEPGHTAPPLRHPCSPVLSEMFSQIPVRTSFYQCPPICDVRTPVPYFLLYKGDISSYLFKPSLVSKSLVPSSPSGEYYVNLNSLNFCCYESPSFDKWSAQFPFAQCTRGLRIVNFFAFAWSVVPYLLLRIWKCFGTFKSLLEHLLVVNLTTFSASFTAQPVDRALSIAILPPSL